MTIFAPPPTLVGFIFFVRTVMGVPTAVLPDSSPVFPTAFDVARRVVNRMINCVDPHEYTRAVYNLGGSNVLNYAQDAPDAPVFKNDLPYFAYYSDLWKLQNFVTGVVQSSSDEGTSVSLVTQKAFEEWTLANLQQAKDSYGRAYLAIAQEWGTLWGVS